MTEEDNDPGRPRQPCRADGPLELRVWGATDEQLAAGLAAARDVLAARGISAGRALVCHSAVAAHELDPSLPEPDAGVRADAGACREAFVAAIEAAGGALDSTDALAFAQGPDDHLLWDALPTLHAWRIKNDSPFLGAQRLDKPQRTST